MPAPLRQIRERGSTSSGPLSERAPRRPPLDRQVLRVTATIFAVVCAVSALFAFAATSLPLHVQSAHGAKASEMTRRHEDSDRESR